MRNILDVIKNYFYDDYDFWSDESAIGVVEIVLILVVLVALVIIFKDQLTALINNIFGSINSKSETVYK